MRWSPAQCAYAQARKWGVFRLGDKHILRACHVGLPLGSKMGGFRMHSLGRLVTTSLTTVVTTYLNTLVTFFPSESSLFGADQ